MILPQGSFEAARSVLEQLGEQGWAAEMRQDEDGGWLVVVLGQDEDPE